MNNISLILAKLSFKFDSPLWLLALIPGVILAFWPYFRIRKDKRRTRERIVSMILHLIILLLATLVLAGFSIREDQTLKSDETIILVDVSKSNKHNDENMVNYLNTVIRDSDPKVKIGIIAFGAGEPKVYRKPQSKPKIDSNLYDYYDSQDRDKEGFIISEGTDMATAISFAATQFEGYKDRFTVDRPLEGCRVIILSDGIETDGNATSAAGQIASMGASIDSVYFQPKDYSDTNEVQLQAVEIPNKNPKPNQPVEANITIKSRTFGEGAKATFKFLDYNAKNPDKSTVIKTEEFDITALEETYTTSLTFSTGGVHTIKVEMTTTVETEEDLSQNNVFYTYVVVQEKTNKVLIIDGSGTGAGAIKSLVEEIKEKGTNEPAYTVEVVDQKSAPTDLSKYGEVILVNVNSTGDKSPAKLPRGYDLLLKNYARNGGGVFTIGGQNTYYYGGMGTDNFNDFLPIKVKPESSTTKEVILLIDRSSGMCGEEGDGGFTSKYGKNRLQVVQDAVMECLAEGVFSPKDYIGVIFFGGKKYTPIEALNLTSASNIIGIKNAVGKDITSITGEKNYLGNTEWRHALEAATKMLQSSKAGDNDHIIMITDGAGDKAEGESAQLDGYPVGSWKVNAAKYTNQQIPGGVPQSCYTDFIFKQYSITTSVINVGCNLSPAKEYLQMMETASDLDKKTHYFYTETKQEIMDAIEIECKNIPTKIINEDQDYFLALQGREMEKLASDEDLPILRGYNGVSLKDGAGALIQTATSKDPIYAEWQYGNGKVGSLMTDLTNEWGQEMISTTDYPKARDVIRYLIDNCFIGAVSGMTSDMSVEFNQKNFTTTVTITDVNNSNLVPAADGSGSLGKIEAYYHSPDELLDPSKTGLSVEEYIEYLCPYGAKDYQFDPMIFADGSFTSDFRMMQPGLYVVSFLRMGKDGNLLDAAPPYQYVTFSYSSEYDTYYDAEKSLATLQNICNSARGKVYYYGMDGMDDNIFSAESQYTSRNIDPVTALMVIALILFILDVCARKFHFLWPHEWFKKKDGQVK